MRMRGRFLFVSLQYSLLFQLGLVVQVLLYPAHFLRLETTTVVGSSSKSNGTSAAVTSSSTSSTHILEISGEHLLFVDGQPCPVRADSVHVGNVLLLDVDMVGNNKFALVTDISHTTRKGLYAPLTAHGTIVVNGILASNYVGVQDETKAPAHFQIGQVVLPILQADLIHWWMTPLRLVCNTMPSHRWCGSISPTTAKSASHDAKGMHYWAATGIHLVQWGEEQHLIFQVLILLTSILIFGALFILEQLVWTTFTWTSTQWCLVLVYTAMVVGYSYHTNKSSITHCSITQSSKQKQQ
jgi:Hint module